MSGSEGGCGDCVDDDGIASTKRARAAGDEGSSEEQENAYSVVLGMNRNLRPPQGMVDLAARFEVPTYFLNGRA